MGVHDAVDVGFVELVADSQARSGELSPDTVVAARSLLFRCLLDRLVRSMSRSGRVGVRRFLRPTDPPRRPPDKAG